VASLEDISAILSITPDRWKQLTSTVPEPLLHRSPAPGEWSAMDCLAHIVEAERQVFPVRIRAILAGQDFAAFDPDAEGIHITDKAGADLANEFARLRTESLKLLATLVESDLPRTAKHQELGIVTLENLLHEWAGHDLMHTVQAERALMQPFIAGCGPWQSYFKDHIA
jgi:DinB superfamily